MCVIYITHMHLSLYPDIYLYLYPYLKLDLYHTHTHTHTHYIYMYQERDPDNLVFNRAEEWRATLEEKELLSKAQPVEQRQVRITHTHIMYILYIYIYIYIYIIYKYTHTHTQTHTHTHTGIQPVADVPSRRLDPIYSSWWPIFGTGDAIH
jgi:hypothetical protein